METKEIHLEKIKKGCCTLRRPYALCKRLSAIIYAIALIVYIARTIISGTFLDTVQVFPFSITDFALFVDDYLAYALFTALLLDVSTTQMSKRRLIVGILLGFLTQSIWITSQDMAAVSFFWFVIAFPSSCSLRFLARCCWISLLVCILTTIVCFAAGLMQERIQDQHGVIRHSLGFTWPNLLSLYATSAVIAFTYDFFEQWKLEHFIIALAVLVAAFIVANGRMSLAYGLLIIFFATVHSFLKNKSRSLPKARTAIFALAMWATPICAASLIFITIVSAHIPEAYAFFYELLDVRLEYAEQFYSQYGFNLFAEKIGIVSYRESIITGATWTNIDISYVRFALMYGILFLICYATLYYLTGLYAKRKNDIVLAFVLVIMALFGISEHITLNPAFNIGVLAIGMMLSSRESLMHSKPQEKNHEKEAIDCR